MLEPSLAGALDHAELNRMRLRRKLEVFSLAIEPRQAITAGTQILYSNGERPMATVLPFHSKRESDRKVYHDNDECPEANFIETENRVQGTDDRPKCKHCDEKR